MTSAQDPFGSKKSIQTSDGEGTIFSLERLESEGIASLDRLPYSIKILLEAVLRGVNGTEVMAEDVEKLGRWNPNDPEPPTIPFCPARVILQDFTGVPAVVDLAALRSAMERMGCDPQLIQPQVPVDLVIDHSVQVDRFGSEDALQINAEIEFDRNRERYEFLKWGKNAFENFRVVPPMTGIVHQVNLEYLARGVLTRQCDGENQVFPDTLVGTDSHTTMINGLGVLGWGVGGIEAEAAMLGQPIYMLAPQVVGFRLHGRLPEGATATDLVLTVTEILRQQGVVGKFVEYYGPGLDHLSLADRATIANMSPEYGATMGFFPIDSETLGFMRATGRPADLIDLVERYTKEQRLFRTDESPIPDYSALVELDLATVEPSLAGPARPQDRIRLADMKSSFHSTLTRPIADGGFGLSDDDARRKVTLGSNGDQTEMEHGAVVIGAITSCTNTSNPSVMLGAGLVAKKAVELGLRVPSTVKTSLAPGSRVVTEYLRKSGLLPYLEQLGFHLVGYGCTTCIGNSGPLPEPVAEAIREGDLVASAVLSGNRNFTGRVHPLIKASYLASPPLVVMFALAGRTDLDLFNEPIGTGSNGQEVHFNDLWPSQEEVREAVRSSLAPEMFLEQYGNVFDGNEQWNRIPASEGQTYQWKEESTYIQEPPFFLDIGPESPGFPTIDGARTLLFLGDSVTTDHISPAGAFSPDTPAGHYLIENGVDSKDFNSYGSRRGNDRVMTRGTFANIRIRNRLAPGTEGGFTEHFPSGETMSIYEASQRYRAEGTPLIVLAGREYGSGSSRDWAAKGTLLLGIKAVLAQSYERIHRSNLVGMGVLPLEFSPGDSPDSLGLSGRETFCIQALDESFEPGGNLEVVATADDGSSQRFSVKVRLDSAVEIHYYRNGGILHTVLRNFVQENSSTN